MPFSMNYNKSKSERTSGGRNSQRNATRARQARATRNRGAENENGFVSANANTQNFHSETTSAGGITRFRGIQNIPASMLQPTYASVPANLAYLDGTRISENLRRFSAYKLKKFTVKWNATVSVATSGTIYSGTFSHGVQMSDYTASLPSSNGGYAGAVYRNFNTNVNVSRYFDHWRPIHRTDNDSNPFTWIAVKGGNVDFRSDGILSIEYDIDVAEPVSSAQSTPATGKVTEFAAVLSPSTGGRLCSTLDTALVNDNAEKIKFTLFEDLSSPAVHWDDAITDAAVLTSHLFSRGTVLDVQKTLIGGISRYMLLHLGKTLTGWSTEPVGYMLSS